MATAAPQLGYIFTALAARKPKDVDTKLVNFTESEDISKATTALADGANPNYRCDGGTKFVAGDTPLHIAARNGSKTLPGKTAHYLWCEPKSEKPEWRNAFTGGKR